MKKRQLITIANENIEIARTGRYDGKSCIHFIGRGVPPSYGYPATYAFSKKKQHERKGLVSVVSATTLEAAKIFEGNVTVLNFASAKWPGGGHLKGSMAQEEYLCYRSTLYTALKNQTEHYAKSRGNLNNGLLHLRFRI